jgi:hypothetical protein
VKTAFVKRRLSTLLLVGLLTFILLRADSMKTASAQTWVQGSCCSRYSGGMCTYTLPGVDCLGIPIGMSLCGAQICAKLLDGPSHHDGCPGDSDPTHTCTTGNDGYCVKYQLGMCVEGEVHCICDVNAVVPPVIGTAGARTYCTGPNCS